MPSHRQPPPPPVLQRGGKSVRQKVLLALTILVAGVALSLWYVRLTTNPIRAVCDLSGRPEPFYGTGRDYFVNTGEFTAEEPWYVVYDSASGSPDIRLKANGFTIERLTANVESGWIKISQSGEFSVQAFGDSKLRLAVMQNRRPLFFVSNWNATYHHDTAISEMSD